LEKLLEAGIELSSVACDITGISGRAMLEALIAGQRDTRSWCDYSLFSCQFGQVRGAGPAGGWGLRLAPGVTPF